jgi:hypothetical protein
LQYRLLYIYLRVSNLRTMPSLLLSYGVPVTPGAY